MLRRLIEYEVKKTKPLWFIILCTFIYVIAMNILITETNVLIEELRHIVAIAILAIFAILYTIIMLSGFSHYVYNLIEDEFIIEKKIGKKSKKMLKINIEDIVEIKSLNEAKAEGEAIYTYKFMSDREYNKAYVCSFEKEDKVLSFIFKPSDRLRKILVEKRYSNGRYKRNRSTYDNDK